MPTVDLSVIGRKTNPIEFEYTWRDVVLYALGVGATAEELSLIYEKEFRARFSNVVYPGDTLTTEGWETDGGYVIQAKTEDKIVLSNAMALID